MSNWTHVAGIVRLDCFRLNNYVPDFDEMFGKECLWGAEGSVWTDAYHNAEKYMPMGSEGTLQKSIWVNPDPTYLSAFTVSVFGDLRDYNSPKLITDWFKTKCKEVKKYHCFVRNATIVAENEYNQRETWTFSDEES